MADVSQETEETEIKSKEDGHIADYTTAKALFAYTQAHQVPAEEKPREGGEGVGEDQVDTVFASTHAPVNFDIATPEFSQVRDLAPSESPITNKDDTEEDESNNEILSTNKDDEAQKDKSNKEEIHSRKASGDYLEKSSNALTGMSVTATARSEKYMTR
jgi:hypothetical protein